MRTINAETLNDYLSSAHMTIMLCRAHAESFSLDPEEVADASWRIELHIAELEGLRKDLAVQTTVPFAAMDDNIIRLPVSR